LQLKAFRPIIRTENLRNVRKRLGKVVKSNLDQYGVGNKGNRQPATRSS